MMVPNLLKMLININDIFFPKKKKKNQKKKKKPQ